MNYALISIGAALLVFSIGLFIYSKYYSEKFSNAAEESSASMIFGFLVLAFSVLFFLLGLFGIGA